MEGLVWAIILFVLLMLVVSSHQKSARRKRVKEAYKFERAPIHGVRKTASRDQLKKAGLL
jgi:hypothetical protein